jgi:hypothetical protein
LKEKATQSLNNYYVRLLNVRKSIVDLLEEKFFEKIKNEKIKKENFIKEELVNSSLMRGPRFNLSSNLKTEEYCNLLTSHDKITGISSLKSPKFVNKIDNNNEIRIKEGPFSPNVKNSKVAIFSKQVMSDNKEKRVNTKIEITINVENDISKERHKNLSIPNVKNFTKIKNKSEKDDLIFNKKTISQKKNFLLPWSFYADNTRIKNMNKLKSQSCIEESLHSPDSISKPKKVISYQLEKFDYKDKHKEDLKFVSIKTDFHKMISSLYNNKKYSNKRSMVELKPLIKKVESSLPEVKISKFFNISKNTSLNEDII